MKNGYEKLSLGKYLQMVGEATAAPGGGSVSAIGGALGAALGRMISGLTLKHCPKIKLYPKRFLAYSQRLLRLAEEDSRAYQEVQQAYRLPRQTRPEKLIRQRKIQKAFLKATKLPLQGMITSLQNLRHLNILVDKVKPNLRSDLAVAVLFSYAAFQGCLANVRTNLVYIKDKSFKQQVNKSLKFLNHQMAKWYQKTWTSLRHYENP